MEDSTIYFVANTAVSCILRPHDKTMHFTSEWESQLPASYLGIHSAEGIITHSPPDIVVADFYSSSCGIGTILKPDVSIIAY